MNSKNKIILAAALAGIVAGTSLTASADTAKSDSKKAEMGDKEKCADGSCKGHAKKGDKEKCADGSCKGHAKKGDKEKCADGSCGDKKE